MTNDGQLPKDMLLGVTPPPSILPAIPQPPEICQETPPNKPPASGSVKLESHDCCGLTGPAGSSRVEGTKQGNMGGGCFAVAGQKVYDGFCCEGAVWKGILGQKGSVFQGGEGKMPNLPILFLQAVEEI